jgi:hypothetical protein
MLTSCPSICITAAGEQEKLAGEINTAMASLNALTEEAGAVVAQQEEAGEAQQLLAAALQEVKERKDKKQEEVREALLIPKGSCDDCQCLRCAERVAAKTRLSSGVSCLVLPPYCIVGLHPLCGGWVKTADGVGVCVC